MQKNNKKTRYECDDAEILGDSERSRQASDYFRLKVRLDQDGISRPYHICHEADMHNPDFDCEIGFATEAD